MTMIACNNKFLIADKRALLLQKSVFGDIVSNRDDSNKINLLSDNELLWAEHSVKAWAAAGNLATSEKIMSAFLQIGNIEIATNCLNSVSSLFVNNEETINIFMLLSNGSNVVVSFGSDNWLNVKKSYTPVCSYDKFHSLTNYEYSSSLLDTFLISCANNDNCSTDYDIYSLEEDKLVLDCKPSEQGVRIACERWRSNISVYPGPKK